MKPCINTTYMKGRERYVPIICETRMWSGQHQVCKTTQGISRSQMSMRGIMYRHLEQGSICNTIHENLVQARGISYTEWMHGPSLKIKQYFSIIYCFNMLCESKLIKIFHWDVWNQALNVSRETKLQSVQEKSVCVNSTATLVFRSSLILSQFVWTHAISFHLRKFTTG